MWKCNNCGHVTHDEEEAVARVDDGDGYLDDVEADCSKCRFGVFQEIQ